MDIPTAEGTIDSGPFVSVVIPHYNDLDGLQCCYKSLLAQTWPSGNFEIIVADNNSCCGLKSVQQTVPLARVVAACEQGAGPARNAGVAASRGTIIAFIDSDCRADPDWLAAGVRSLSRFDFIGGEVVVFADKEDRPTAVESFEIVFNFDFRRYIEKVGFTGTGNMFVWRTCFRPGWRLPRGRLRRRGLVHARSQCSLSARLCSRRAGAASCTPQLGGVGIAMAPPHPGNLCALLRTAHGWPHLPTSWPSHASVDCSACSEDCLLAETAQLRGEARCNGSYVQATLMASLAHAGPSRASSTIGKTCFPPILGLD